jgi:hypothetical protein
VQETLDDLTTRKYKYHEMNGLLFRQWTPAYIGWIPTFSNHSVIIVTLPNGTNVYLDNRLYGGSDDHIFFDIPDDIVDYDSQQYKDYEKERADFLESCVNNL